MNSLKFRKQWNDLEHRVQYAHKAFIEFFSRYGIDEIDGSKKKKVPPRPELQLIRELLRNECARLNNERCSLIQQTYAKVGDRRIMDKSLFEPLTEEELEELIK